jgi:hypothetical protein
MKAKLKRIKVTRKESLERRVAAEHIESQHYTGSDER